MDSVEQAFGCPPRLCSLIQQLHVGGSKQYIPLQSLTVCMQSPLQVRMGNSISDPFAVTQVVKQRCVLAATLFMLYLTAVLELSPQHLYEGVYIRTRFDGKLFNLSRIKCKTRVTDACVHALFYANDSAPVPDNEASLQGFAWEIWCSCKRLRSMNQPH